MIIDCNDDTGTWAFHMRMTQKQAAMQWFYSDAKTWCLNETAWRCRLIDRHTRGCTSPSAVSAHTSPAAPAEPVVSPAAPAPSCSAASPDEPAPEPAPSDNAASRDAGPIIGGKGWRFGYPATGEDGPRLPLLAVKIPENLRKSNDRENEVNEHQGMIRWTSDSRHGYSTCYRRLNQPWVQLPGATETDRLVCPFRIYEDHATHWDPRLEGKQGQYDRKERKRLMLARASGYMDMMAMPSLISFAKVLGAWRMVSIVTELN